MIIYLQTISSSRMATVVRTTESRKARPPLRERQARQNAPRSRRVFREWWEGERPPQNTRADKACVTADGGPAGAGKRGLRPAGRAQAARPSAAPCVKRRSGARRRVECKEDAYRSRGSGRYWGLGQCNAIWITQRKFERLGVALRRCDLNTWLSAPNTDALHSERRAHSGLSSGHTNQNEHAYSALSGTISTSHSILPKFTI